MLFPYIIFSDLDGTLLDYQTYAFSTAQTALRCIKENKIPLILVSSKTRREMIHYQKELEISGFPFVVENGSAVYTPIGYFNEGDLGESQISGNFECYNLGILFARIKDILDKISLKHEYNIRGFHNISRQEIQSLTGLCGQELNMALSREYSIPLLFDERSEEILKEEIDNFNLQILYGGRFMHLLGKTNKGKAMKLILRGYEAKLGRADLKTIALGDSLNDYAMLKEADFPILVKRHDNSYEKRIRIDNLIHSPEIGPRGWNISVLKILKMGGDNE